jgi:hypothetical protein
MRVGADLQSKALLALEEVCAECRFGKPRRSHAVRFALAYLWGHSSAQPAPFIAFWRELANWNDLLRWRQADQALAQIYAAIGAPTTDREELTHIMWRAAQARHQRAD